LRVSEIRLSSRGNYVVSYGKASFVYELPSQPIAGNGVS
jgi:hypothetical protein